MLSPYFAAVLAWAAVIDIDGADAQPARDIDKRASAMARQYRE
jgi:hypothetical protein